MKKMPLVVLALLALTFGCSRGDNALVTGPSVSGLTQAQLSSHGPSYNTHLRGNQEVPPVATLATGEAVLFLSKDQKTLSFKVLVADIQDVTGAYIHCGARGANGPVVVSLYDGSAVTTSGTLAAGAVSDVMPAVSTAECPGGVADFAALLAKMRSGDAYVNVVTVAEAEGEIRGQID